MSKERLDVLLVQRGLVETRNRAQSLIMMGRVQVDGRPVTKAGTQVSSKAAITLESDLPYVSRGGIKLAAALDCFEIDPSEAICADVGASTGGFTDVLLQRGAAKVYAIDVGYGQLAWKLRQDQRVAVMERTNARRLEWLGEPIDLTTVDASFISLKLLLPAIIKWLNQSAQVVALVKPQFEAGSRQVSKGGVVRDRAIHCQVLEEITAFGQTLGLTVCGLTPSPITGPAGNHEFLLHLGWHTHCPLLDVKNCIVECLADLPAT